MREIKFRAWDTLNKKMITDFIDGGEKAFLDKCGILCYYYRYILMQFTGLKDRNGKEIYEGDLFKLGAEKEVFEVRFEHGCFLAYHNNKQYGLLGELQMRFILVIGNIYENPELLEEK